MHIKLEDASIIDKKISSFARVVRKIFNFFPSAWLLGQPVFDDKSVHAEREEYTEDPLANSRAVSEQATSDFITTNPSGVFHVNGASVSMKDINNQVLGKFRIDANKKSVDLCETNTVSAGFLCLICYFSFYT